MKYAGSIPAWGATNKFWSKVDIKTPLECWNWKAGKNNDGYGYFWYCKKMKACHRLSWEFNFGSILGGLQVLHRCDNPACVNPWHLFLGTHKINMLDRKTKKRGVDNRGENHPQGKLTEQEVRIILKDDRAYKEIAEDYSVSPSTIGSIKARYTWKCLK